MTTFTKLIKQLVISESRKKSFLSKTGKHPHVWIVKKKSIAIISWKFYFSLEWKVWVENWKINYQKDFFLFGMKEEKWNVFHFRKDYQEEVFPYFLVERVVEKWVTADFYFAENFSNAVGLFGCSLLEGWWLLCRCSCLEYLLMVGIKFVWIFGVKFNFFGFSGNLVSCSCLFGKLSSLHYNILKLHIKYLAIGVQKSLVCFFALCQYFSNAS